MGLLTYIYIITGVTLSVGYASYVGTPPSNISASVGDTITFRCEIIGDEKEGVVWQRSIYEAGKELPLETIYRTWPSDQKLDESKYSFSTNKLHPLDTFLTVKNVELRDAGRYSCRPLRHKDVVVGFGILFVIGMPMITLPPAIFEGIPATIKCEIKFSNSREMKAAHFTLSLVLTIGSQIVHGFEHEPEHGHLEQEETIELDATYNHQEIQCAAKVDSAGKPFQGPSTARKLIVFYHVRNIKLVPDKKIYHPEEQINCTADGNPPPSVRWARVDQKGKLEDGPSLSNTENWRCIASNEIKRVPMSVQSSTISFKDMCSRGSTFKLDVNDGALFYFVIWSFLQGMQQGIMWMYA